MAGLKLEGFLGLAPRYSPRLLNPMQAQIASNTKLTSGEIRGFRALREDSTVCNNAQRVFRVPSDPQTIVAPSTDYVLVADGEGSFPSTSFTEESYLANAATFFESANINSGGPFGNTGSFYLTGAEANGATGDAILFGDSQDDYDAWNLNGYVGDFTITMWVFFAALPGVSQRRMLISRGNSDTRQFQIEIYNNAGTYQIRTPFGFDVSNATASIATPSTFTWYHVAVQRRGTALEILWNGTRILNNTSYNFNPSTNDTSPIVLGAWRNSTQNSFTDVHDGRLAGVCFHKNGTLIDATSGTYTVPTAHCDPIETIVTNPTQFLCFDNRNIDIVRSPIINDTYDRYYWAGETERPQMNTAQRIADGDPSFYLGIPVPASAPTVTPPGGSDETRAYVFTYESEYGEEGPPSPPTIATGDAGTWVVSNLPATAPDGVNRNITKINIYRTVPGEIATDFFYVGEVALGTTTFNDNVTSEVAASNSLLESQSWVEPPSDMEGFVVMPNGYLVGWVGRRLLFSEPYRPHAWPAEYELAVEFNIVGLAVFGSTLVIGTESQAYLGQGVSPASFTTQKVDSIEPCLSRRGMVPTIIGVYYPSPNGLVLANGSGVKVITKDILTKEEWEDYFPDQIYAAHEGLQYIAFYASNRGFLYDPEEGANKFVTLDGFTNVDGIETDHYTGRVYLIQNDRYMEFDPKDGTERINWEWKSKTYQFPKPMNFGAYRLNAKFGVINTVPNLTTEKAYNASLFGVISDPPFSQDFLITIGEWNTGSDHGFTLYGADQGSTNPSLAYLTVEDGKISELVEMTFYTSGTGLEIFIATQNPNTLTVDPPVEAGATALFTTFSQIEVDHAGGTLVLDTRDIGNGGDMWHSASSESADYSTFYFPNVAKVWDTGDVGNTYEVRFYY